MRTSNPMMKEKVFTQAIAGTETMTLQGAVNKTVALLALVVIGASYSWNLYYNQGPEAVQPWMIGGLIGGFVFAMITIFKASLGAENGTDIRRPRGSCPWRHFRIF